MANRYWVGGTGTWNTSSTTNWSASTGGASGASVPTAADSVFFDQASTYTVTMTGTLLCLDITVSAGTVTFATGTGDTLAVSGSMSLVAGTVWNSTTPITFNAVTTGQTITTNGTTLNGAVTFNGAGGEWSLGSSLTVASNLITTLTAGTLSLNGFNLTTGYFSTAGAATRSVAFGTNNIVLNTSSGIALSMAVLGGFTYTGTGGFTADASVVRTYSVGNTSGGSSTNSPNLTFTGSGTAIPVLSTGSWFNNLNFGTTGFTLATTTLNLNSLTLSSGGTYTNLSATMRDTGTITPNGKTILALTVNHTGTTTLAGALVCTNYTQTAGTINFATFNVNCSGNVIYTDGLLNNIGTITVMGTWTCAGTFTLTQGTIQTLGFVVTGGFNYNGGTLTTAPTYSGLSFTHTSGTVILGQAMSLGDSTYTLTSGTLNLNNYDLTLSYFSSSNANTRSIAFGTGNIITISVGGALALDMANATNFSCTGTGGFSASSGTGRTFTFGTTGGTSANALNLTFTGASGAATQTLTTGSWFNKLDFGSSTLTLPATTLNLNGLTLSSGGTFTSLTATMRGTGTITPNGKTIAALTVNHTGTTTFASALSCSTYTQTAGDVNFATFNLTCSSTAIYTAGALSNIGNISCTSWTINTGATFTLSQGTITPTSFIVLSATSTFNYNGGTITTPAFTQTAGTVTLSASLALSDTGTYTLTAGTLNLNGFNLTTGIFSSSNSNTRSISFGTNNIILSHTTAATTVLSMATATNFSYTGTGGFTADASRTRTFNFASASAVNAAIAPNVTLTGSGTSVITFVSLSEYGKLDFGTTAFTVPAATLYLNSLILSSGGTFTSLAASMAGTGTITGNGKTIAALTVNHTGTTTFASALGCTTYTQTAGDVNFATFNLTCSSTAIYTAGTLSNIGNISCTTWTVNTGATFTLTQGTITPLTSFIVLSATSTFNYNGGTITTVAFIQTAGTVTLGADASTTLASNCTYTLTAGTLNLNGFNLSTGFFASTGAGTRSIAFGTNNITLIGASGTVLSMAALAGFTWSGTGGFTADASVVRTYSVGSTSGGSTTNAPNLAFTGSGTAIPVLTTGSWFNNLNFGTTAFTLAATTLNLNTFTLSSGGTFTNLSITLVGSGTINTGGKTIAGFAINNGALTTTLAAALSCSTYTQTAGTIDFANFNLACSSTATYTAGTLTNTGTITCTTWTCAGTFTMTNGTITPSTSFAVTGGFNYNGGTLSAVPTFTHTSGTVTLGQAYALTATGTYSLTTGTLNLNGFNLTTGIFSSSGTQVRAIAFGTNNIILAHTTAATTVLSMATATNFSYTGTGGFTAAADITRTYTFGTTGGLATNSPNLTLTGTGSAVQTLTTGSWFNILNFGTTTFNPGTTALNLNSLVLSSGGTYTGLTPSMEGTGSITSNGKTVAGLTIDSGVGTTTFVDQLTFATATATLTLSSGNLNLSGFNLTVGIFSSSNTSTRSIIFGTNNIILAHTTAATTVLSMATATGFTWTGTGGFTAAADITRTYTFGTTIGGSATNSPNLTLTGSGTAIQTFTTGSWFDILNFGTTAFAVPTTSLNIDTLILSSGGTFTGLQPILTRTQTWTSQFSKQLAGLGFNLAGGTLTLDNTQTYITNSAFELANGTLDLGGYDLTIGQFTGSNSNTRSILFGTNNIILAHTTAATTVLSMATATGFTYTGTGGFTAAADITRTYTFGSSSGGTSTNSPNLTLTGSGTAVQTFITGSYFNTLNFGTTASTVAATVNLNNLILSSGGTFSNLNVTTVGTGTITTNGKTINLLTINCPSGTTTLAGALTTNASASNTLTAGTLDLAGYTMTVGSFISDNTNTRSILFGSGNIILAHTTAATTVLSMATATGFTYTGTGGFTADASITRTYSFGTTGGSSTNAPNLTLTGSGTAIQTFTTGSWFDILNFGTTAFTVPTTTLNIDTLTLSSGSTFTNLTPVFTRTQTWTSQFSKQLGGIGVNGTGVTLTLDNTQTYTATSQCILTVGTLNLGGYDLTIGTFSSTNANTRSIAFGTNNIILSTTTAASTVLSMATATGFTYTGTGGFTAAADITRTYTFGTTGGSSTNSPNLTLTGSGTAIQTFTTGSWFNNLNFGTTAFAVPATSLNVDSITLSSGGTFTSLTITTVDTGTITSNGKTIAALTINCSNGTTTLAGALTTGATATTTLTAGTLNLNGFDLTTGIFSSTGSGVRSIVFGTNNIILTHTTAATTVLSMSNATSFTWTGTGGFTADASRTRTFTFGNGGGGTATNAPNLTLTGSGTSIATLTTNSWFNNLNFGTTAFILAATALNLESLTMSSGGTFTNLTATMVGTGTITSNGKTVGTLTINHSGTTTLQSAITVAGTTTLTSGTLDLANFKLTTDLFSSSNTNTRSIAFGSGNIELDGASTVLSCAIATGFTWTGTGGFISLAATGGKTYQFGTTGGTSTNAPNLSIYVGAGNSSFSGGSWFNILNFTGSTSTALNSSINVNTLILAVGGLYTSFEVTMVGTGSITSNGRTIEGLTINHSGTTTLLDALTVGLGINSDRITYLTSGTLDLANFTLSVVLFSSNNSNTRSIAFGSGNIVLATPNSNDVNLDMANATGFTWTGTGGFTSAMSLTRTFTFGTTGGLASNAPNLSLTSGASIPTITTGSWFKALTFTGTTSSVAGTVVNVDTLTLATGGTYTGLAPVFTRTQTWSPQFSKQLGGIGVNGTGVTLTLEATQTYTGTSQCIVTAGTLDLGGSNLTIGTFSSNNTNTRVLVFGTNNIILATTTAGATNIDMANATGFTYTGTGGFTSAMSVTRTFSFGSTAGGTATNAPNLSLTSGASIPTITTGSWFKALNFTGTTSTPATTIINVDTLTLATGGTYTGLAPVFTRTQTWSPQFSKPLNGIGVNGSGITLTLEATQTYSGTTTLIVNDGTLAISTLNLNFNSFSSSGTGSRSITGTGILNIFNNWTVTSGSGFTGSTYSINLYGSIFTGGGGSYGTLIQKNNVLSITGSNSFADIQAIVAPLLAIDYLVVAGGGGGGGGSSGGGGGGGGGAGGMILSNTQLAYGTTYSVTVGAGGGGGTQVSGTQGLNSIFDSYTAIGGGYGARRANGGAGGSGGGAGGGLSTQYSGGAGTAGQGNAGGINPTNGDNSAGGGGAGGVGGNGIGPSGSGSTGPGGIGLQSSISGVATYYAGGGGGGGLDGPGAGGLGGGGQGAATGTGSAGTANTGGGGGGGGQSSTTGGQGGSGVVIIRLSDSVSIGTTTGSPTITVDGGYRVYKWTSTGSIIFYE